MNQSEFTSHIQRSFSLHTNQNNERSDHVGKLYLVATPIGNLEDMTFRGVRMLQEVDIIAAEDTRNTRKLLSHFNISTKLISYHEHNKRTSGLGIIKLLNEGKQVALVSDAGLPAISDPGYDLVRLAIDSGICVIPIPGANAGLSALIASGLPTDRFMFIGFLPRDKKLIRQELERLKSLPMTSILYESPHRIVRTLEMIKDVLGNRQIALARELTKRYEEFIRADIETALKLLQTLTPKGEYCIIIEGENKSDEIKEESEWWKILSINEHVAHYESQNGGNRKEAMKKTAIDRKVSKREVYQACISAAKNLE